MSGICYFFVLCHALFDILIDASRNIFKKVQLTEKQDGRVLLDSIQKKK